ncbi:MT-A70 family protein [Trichomonas vaginalis G3]|uniref:mRNA m(6)A methyltransferase n=1 Tax=Trichomonas vaginalis (strain ATCC PRA-98 / G3) TaxID=412133 RepID=A2G7D5_TRIV3|nr:primary miRNA methylation [Trichomonas vaginalis G3]EAX86932.1 MT-A70 family protein [Trichomonas vaginalis G3]KAI5545847.1 primary miRNA methylation [Trichomonas vaginalis G3]|eukprot:XP_001299862.1 MT-A70 family protein [Trichomonas vaginalis G3]
MDSLRRGKRKPNGWFNEEYLGPSGSNSESDDSEEYIPKPKSQINGGRKLKYTSDDDDDDEDYYEYGMEREKKHYKERLLGPTRKALKTEVISSRQCFANRISSNSPEASIGPDGNKCRFIRFKDLKPNLLNLDKILKEGETGVNTILPAYDPVARNKLQFFELDDSPIQFTYKDLERMSLEDLKTALEIVEEDIQNLPHFPEYAKDFVLIPPYSEHIKQAAPIKADIRYFDWETLGKICQFDVILMDPPWNIQPAQTTRGVELGYELMLESEIASMKIPLVQTNGYCFMWVVASFLPVGVSMLQGWGYKVIDFINWIKTSKYGRYRPSNGYFLQHDKETCLVGIKGKPLDGEDVDIFNDLIIDERGARQSHKPPSLYDIIERMFPGRLYLEIFARAHNEREGWVSLGLEVVQ